MSTRYVTLRDDGTVSLTELVGDGDDNNGHRLVKTLFELSRLPEYQDTFNPAIHTVEAIADGITGHRPLQIIGQCDDTDLPQGRYFRDTWTWDNGRIVIDMDKARTVHMDNIRRARDAKLASLDIPWMMAIESGDTVIQSKIVALKVRLRDIPQDYHLEYYVTPEALQAFWPDGLDRG